MGRHHHHHHHGSSSGYRYRNLISALQQMFGFLAFCFMLVLLLRYQKHHRPKRTPQLKAPSSAAYITVVCQEEQLKSAMVLVHSIKNTKTPYDVILLSHNVTGLPRQIFEALGAKINPLPTHIPDAEVSALVMPSTASSCLTAKISMWTMVQYSKVVFLDPLMLVLENIDEVFGHPEPTAGPDNTLPDRFNPGLMVIEPNLDTYHDLVKEYSSVKHRLQPGWEDLVFFNHFFSHWPRLGPDYHLGYGYNAQSRLGYSATWNEWVHPELKVAHFGGAFERWDDLIDKHYPPTRRYDHLRWEVLRDMYGFLVQQGVVPPSEETSNPLCQTDYMRYSQGAPVPRKASVVISSGGNHAVLQTLIFHFASMRFVYKIYVMPKAGVSDLTTVVASWNASKPVQVLPPNNFSMTERMQPIQSLETDCVILSDDSVMVSGVVLASAFKMWMESPHRVVGFFPHAHYRDPYTSELVFVADAKEQYSMVGSNLLIMHADYFQSYTCTLKQSVRDYADQIPACADITFNFLVSWLTSSPPLLIVDPDKRVTEDVASSVEDHTRIGSMCLNDLEAMLGRMPLRNSTRAKFHLEQDVFTKVEFKHAKGLGSAATIAEDLQYEPIFDHTKQSSNDENFRFMPTIRRITNMPEVVVFPSPQHPKKILCVLGNSSSPVCFQGAQCNNSFTLVTYDSIPLNALMLLGTSLVMHSRYGFDDRFHTPNILANLFYPYPDYTFMRPARALFYKRGGLDMRLSPWGRLLFKAILGDHIAPFRIRNGDRPVCFERAVMTRRYRPAAQERSIVLRDVQERALAYCSQMKGMAPSMRGFASKDAATLRVLLLHGDAASGGYGVVQNLNEVVKGLRGKCKRVKGCEFVVVGESNFTNFCQQVLYMGAANMFITVSGDGTMNHVMWMRPGMAVLELVPFGLREYDPRVLKVYAEACRWVGLDIEQVAEQTGPDCPKKNASCRFMYRKRAIKVDVGEVLGWFNSTRHALIEAIRTSSTETFII